MKRRDLLKFVGLGSVAMLGSGPFAAAAGNLPKPEKSENFDVVVIGAGFSGLVTACNAAQAGAKVVVLEKLKQEKTGGNSALAGGIVILPLSESKKDIEKFADENAKKCLNRGNAEIRTVIAENITPALNWLKKVGVEYTEPMVSPSFAGKSVTFLPGAYKGCPIALKKLREILIADGGKVYNETKVRQLILNENGNVIGARAMTSSGMKDFYAKSVVIAAGGYAANKELLEAFIDPDADEMMVRGDKNATGDGLMLAKEAGAGWVNMGGIASLHIAAVHPSNTSSGNPFNSVIYCLGINQDGKRYVDESLGYVANGKATLKQPGQTIALIFDKNVYDINGIQFGLNVFENIKQPVIEADTLDELAKKINVPADSLKKTIDDYNNAVEADNKAPKAVPPKANFAYKLNSPKYYAFYPLVPGITLSFGGIKIDNMGKALEADGTPIPGLFAVGEGAGGVYYDDYIGGASLANCIAMGYMVGTTIYKK